MCRSTAAALAAAILLGASGPADAAQTAGKKLDPKVVAGQKAHARANWKRVHDKDDPPHHETEHFLLYGTVMGRTLKEIGESLEKTYALAWKTLGFEKEEPWPGKLAVYFATDRRNFSALVRAVERRLPEESEHGSVRIKSDNPSIVASPSKEAVELNPEGEACAQVAAALLAVKMGTTPPEWLAEGFGRATALRTGPPAALTAEHRKAYGAVVAPKRHVRDTWGTNMKAEHAPVARASLVEYLAYSGKSTKFLPFVMAMRPQGENMQTPTPDAAFAAINVEPGRLSFVWQAWVKFIE